MQKQTFTPAKQTAFSGTGNNEIFDEIFEGLDILSALPELNPRNKGNSWVIDCPACKTKSTAYMYRGWRVIECNRRNNCGKRTRLWEYFLNRDNLTKQQTLIKLAGYANIELQEPSEKIIKKIEAQNRNEEIIAKTQGFFIEQLWSDTGAQARKYLIERGYSEKDIREMKLGFNPGYEKTKNHLFKKHQVLLSETETALNFLKSRDSHSITFFYHDASGKIETLWGRTLDPNEKAKYLPYSETNKSCPFGLHTARGESEVIVVEGYMDQLAATAKGLTNIVATGGSELTTAQIETLTKTRCNRVFLCLDNDDAGRKGTESSIKRLNKASLEIFVVKIPTDYKDPDEFICKKGIEAFRECIENAQSAGTWLAETILLKYETEKPSGRRDAINEASDWFKKLDPISRQDLQNNLSAPLDIPKEKWAAETDKAKQQEAEKKDQENCEVYVKQAQKLLYSKSFEELSNLKKPHLQSKTHSEIKPYTVEMLIQDLNNSPEGLKTGYRDLDEIDVRIEHGITLISGRPGHGKTTLMLNLLTKMIKNTNLEFYFFSYEETLQKIAVKIIMILCGTEIHGAKSNFVQIRGYIKNKNNQNIPPNPEIDDALEKFDELIKNKRLNIIATPHTAKKLSEKIENIKSDKTGAIFVDYMQKIPNKEKFGTRQLSLQDSSAVLLQAATLARVPLIIGAQLGRDKNNNPVRLDNIREAGDLEQDANLVLAVYNPEMKDDHDEKTQTESKEIILNIIILKRREGARKKIQLTFTPQTLRIEDESKKPEKEKKESKDQSAFLPQQKKELKTTWN